MLLQDTPILQLITAYHPASLPQAPTPPTSLELRHPIPLSRGESTSTTPILSPPSQHPSLLLVSVCAKSPVPYELSVPFSLLAGNTHSRPGGAEHQRYLEPRTDTIHRTEVNIHASTISGLPTQSPINLTQEKKERTRRHRLVPVSECIDRLLYTLHTIHGTISCSK